MEDGRNRPGLADRLGGDGSSRRLVSGDLLLDFKLFRGGLGLYQGGLLVFVWVVGRKGG